VALDTRRESNHIQRELLRYQARIGEAVIWFEFDVDNSQFDRVYNEGGRFYRQGRAVATLWVDQGEAPEQYLPEGRRTVVTLRFAVAARTITEVGIGLQEAHGHRIYDRGLINEKWFDDRLNDVLYYDGRYWEVNNFQIRGRIREDNILGVTCTETYPEDEYTFDFPPAINWGLPVAPIDSGYGGGAYDSGPYGGDQ
jgi:hypothetical protein